MKGKWIKQKKERAHVEGAGKRKGIEEGAAWGLREKQNGEAENLATQVRKERKN